MVSSPTMLTAAVAVAGIGGFATEVQTELVPQVTVLPSAWRKGNYVTAGDEGPCMKLSALEAAVHPPPHYHSACETLWNDRRVPRVTPSAGTQVLSITSAQVSCWVANARRMPTQVNRLPVNDVKPREQSSRTVLPS
eukprot:SAG31_NODE_32_length_32319_cov_28.042681_26_plen_137_part_00